MSEGRREGERVTGGSEAAGWVGLKGDREWPGAPGPRTKRGRFEI